MTASVVAAAAHAHAIPQWYWAVWVPEIIFATLTGIWFFHRGTKVPTSRQTNIELTVWLAHAILVGSSFAMLYGLSTASQFASGFVAENALSVDNIFVWRAVLQYFRVPREYHGRILAWGIMGAIVLRAGFILVGLAFLNLFQPILLGLGLYLWFTAYKLLPGDDDQFDAQKNRVIRVFRKLGWIQDPSLHEGSAPDDESASEDEEGDNEGTSASSSSSKGSTFTVRLYLVIIAIMEFIDVLFALDSIPVVVAVTKDSLAAWMSNMCAVLGLRALYFILDKWAEKFWALDRGVVAVLFWMGLLTILQEFRALRVPGLGWWDVPVGVNLGIIVLILGAAMAWSLRRPQEQGADNAQPAQPS